MRVTATISCRSRSWRRRRWWQAWRWRRRCWWRWQRWQCRWAWGWGTPSSQSPKRDFLSSRNVLWCWMHLLGTIGT